MIERYPENETFIKQHTQVVLDKTTVKLPYMMMSMNKIKGSTGQGTAEIAKFIAKYRGPYVLSAKLDGMSALYTTESAVPHLYTRGNGTFGNQIDHLIPYLNLPTNKGIAIRGELIIREKLFKEKYGLEYSNSRNFVSGKVNKKHFDKADVDIIKDIDFVAYEVIKPANLKPSTQFEYLATLTPKPIIANNASISRPALDKDSIANVLIEWRKNYPYTIDGVICADDKVYDRTDSNPEHAFAFKMAFSFQEATVVDVLWEASKDGKLFPRVQIEPIGVGGVTVTYLSGKSARFIVDNKIGPGAIVRIVRAGDVIPDILKDNPTVKAATGSGLPKYDYEWLESGADIKLKDEDKSTNVTVQLKNISKFFKDLEVEGLGEANTKKLIAMGADSVPKILALTVKEFEKAENFKEKMATKVYKSIHSKVDSASLVDIAAASNIFGKGFGGLSIGKILKEQPDILTSSASDGVKIGLIQAIGGFGSKTGTAFVAAIPDFVKFLTACQMTYKLQTVDKAIDTAVDKAETINHALKGKIIVMSEFTNSPIKKAVLAAKLVALGVIIEETIKKTTDFLVMGEIKETSKMKKAMSIGMPKSNIMEVGDFITKYDVQ